MSNTEVIVDGSSIEILTIGIQGPPGAAGVGGSGGGGLFITNVGPTSSGIVGSKNYASGTIPSNVDLLSCSTDTTSVRVYVFAEGGTDAYTPTVTIEGITVSNFVQDATDKRTYTGSADIVLSGSGVVTATSSTGAEDTVTITVLAAGPEVQSFTLGALPGTQTEAKQGDVVPVSGTVENDATAISVLNFGAAQSGSVSLGAADSGGAGYKTFSGTISVANRTGLLAGRIQAQNSFGTTGNTFDSTNSITLNQTYPQFTLNSVAYPATQGALKDSESATVDLSLINFDTVQYSSPDSTLSVANSTTYEQLKNVTRISGDYVNSGTNLQVIANRAANDATTTENVLVKIQNVAPTAAITIAGSPARLISSPAGQNYTIQITANQTLASAPSLSASSGTFTGGWTGSGAGPYSRTLVINDTDSKGAQTFSSLLLPGLSGRDGNVITSGASYTVGGFTNRTITFAAFSQFEAIGTSVTDINKCVASYTGATQLTLYFSTQNNFQGFTITDNAGSYSATGDHVFITDQAFAGSNTSGTLQVDIEETA